MKLDQRAFFDAINEGREIEICFREKWYFIRANKTKKMTTYFFYEIANSQFNKILSFDNIQELLHTRIQDISLIDVLSNLNDYTIF